MNREIVCPNCGTAVELHESALIGLDHLGGSRSDPEAASTQHDGSVDPRDESTAPADLRDEPPPDGWETPTTPEPPLSDPIMPVAEISPELNGLDLLRSSGSGEVAPSATVSTAPVFETELGSPSPAEVQGSPPVDPFLESLARADAPPDPGPPDPGSPIVPGLDLSSPQDAPKPHEPPRSRSEELPVGGDDRSGSSLGTAFLGSYASAVTLALIWLLWRGQAPTPNQAPTLPASSRVAIEGGGDREFVARLQDLPAVLTTAIGRPLRVGDLEIIPLAIQSGQVQLVSATSDRRRDGGDGALKLRVRLRNLSESKSFAPLELNFLREPDRGIPECLIVAGDHLILPYRLATQSEWEIVDQSFPKLSPGEEFETVIISEVEARGKLARSMTWRLRVRTAPDQTAMIGVQFHPEEIEEL